MRTLRRLAWLVCAALLWTAAPLAAQPQPPLQGGQLAAAGCPAGCATLDVAGMGTAAVQLTGTWTGTVTFEVSTDGGTYTALDMTPPNSTTATSTATANGQWSGSVAGYRLLRVRMSAYTSGTAVATLSAASTGGGGSAGGGGGGGVVTIDDSGGDDVSDDANNAIRVNVVAGAAAGVSHVDDAGFTAATDDVVPAAGLFDDTAPDSVNEGDAGVLRMSANRNLYSTIRDAAGNERGVNVTANNELLVELGAGDADVGNVDLELAGTAVSGGNGTTDAGTIRVTVSSDSTGVLSVDDNGAALTVDNGGTFAVQVDGAALTALQLIDNAVSGAGFNITQLGGAAVPIGAGSEAAALRVTVATDSTGLLPVTCGDCSGSGVSHVDDAAFTPATDDVVPIAGAFDDTTPDSVNEGDAGVVRMSANRNLYTTLRDAAGNERGANVDASNRLTVIADLGATDNAVLDDIADGIAVTNAGTFATQVTGDALTALQLIDNLVSVEDNPAGSGFAGMGLLAVRQDTQSDLAADGDFIPLTVDDAGGLRVTIVAGAGAGGTSLADDADFTAGTTSFTPAGGFYQSSVTACTDGDTCAVGLTAQRTMKVTLFSAAGAELTTSTDKTEDVAESGADTGPLMLAVRRDTAASSSGTSGDFSTVNVDSLGRLWTSGAAVEDAAETAGGIVLMQGTVRRDAAASSAGTDGDNATLNTDSLGRLWVTGSAVEDAAETAGGILAMAGTVRRDTMASSAGTTGDNATANTDANGLLWTRSADPCSALAKTFVPIDIVTATTVELANAVASQFFYVCSIDLHTNAANNVVIAEDDTDGCGSISAGVTGGTTAAEGYNFAANGGRTIGNGTGTIAKTTTANRYLCILTSAATQLSGSISFVSAP